MKCDIALGKGKKKFDQREDIKKRDTYVEVVKMRAEVDVNIKQISSLWEFVNSLRDRFKNGH